MNKEDIFYNAVLARDPRFDGKFFTGVKTTGIYCRPICPARPKKENVEFFNNSLEAEHAGYRPCLRCRPESAPLSPAWIGKSAVVQRAVKILQHQEAHSFQEDEFAAPFGISARHLRRLFIEEIGKTPKQLFFESRLNLSRKLITETSIPMTEVALASGFKSLRRFNGAFKDRFKKAPSEIRRHKLPKEKGISIHLPYRPPFDFEGLLKSYQNHTVGNLEWFDGQKMFRVVTSGDQTGLVAISNVPSISSLKVEIDFPSTAAIPTIISRVRSMFDLNSDPVLIANALEKNPTLKKLLKNYPGIRLPSGWDGFEVAIGTILGQLVSMERTRALVNDLIEIAGRDSGMHLNGKSIKLFPSPQNILDSDLSGLKTTGIRRQTLIEFCRAIIEKRISLMPTQEVNEFLKNALAIKGIGPWTAQYMALKVLRDTDTFPASDLILARALESHPLHCLEKISPWRGYAAALFWRNYSLYSKKKTPHQRSKK